MFVCRCRLLAVAGWTEGPDDDESESESEVDPESESESDMELIELEPEPDELDEVEDEDELDTEEFEAAWPGAPVPGIVLGPCSFPFPFGNCVGSSRREPFF